MVFHFSFVWSSFYLWGVGSETRFQNVSVLRFAESGKTQLQTVGHIRQCPPSRASMKVEATGLEVRSLPRLVF